jgi:hypothetical protein
MVMAGGESVLHAVHVFPRFQAGRLNFAATPTGLKVLCYSGQDSAAQTILWGANPRAQPAPMQEPPAAQTVETASPPAQL